MSDRIWSCPLAIDTPVSTGAVALEDTSGTKIHEFNVGAVICNPYEGHGAALNSGVGIQLHNLMGGNSAVMRGSLVFAQGTS